MVQTLVAFKECGILLFLSLEYCDRYIRFSVSLCYNLVIQ